MRDPNDLDADEYGDVQDNVDGDDDFDDDWLEDEATPAQQRMAMRHWFLARYTDPANEMPWDGEEKRYVYMWGGPYDAGDELRGRFGNVVPGSLIDDVVADLQREVGHEWAPLRYGEDYDDRFDLDVEEPDQPLNDLAERNQRALDVLKSLEKLYVDPADHEYLERLIYGSLITNLETFLWQTAYYWIEARDEVVRACVENMPVFNEQTIKLGDLFKKYETIKSYIKAYLQGLVWHQFDKVALLYDRGLGIKLPSLKQFELAVTKRHDIVHRSGLDHDGNAIDVTRAEIEALASAITKFAGQVSELAANRFIASKF